MAITKEQAEALIQEQVSTSIFQDVPKESTFLGLARKLPNMTSGQTRLRVLDYLPLAYWVSGETGFKKTSEQAWDNVFLNAEELAVIVPIAEATLDDSDFDIIAEVMPRVNEAIGACIDEAVIFGIGRPEGWRADIITTARQAGNNVSYPGDSDMYTKLLGVNGVWDQVETDGYTVTGAIGRPGFQAKLRSIRDEVGNLLFATNLQESLSYNLNGVPVRFPANGAFDADVAELVAGDWGQAVYAIRQDVTTKILTEGVIQNPENAAIVYNLAQQDMLALRVKFRMGWALPNPATRLDEGRTACPFAYLEPAVPATTKTVTFTIQDGSGAIEGANVEVEGARMKTGSNGKAVFNLRAGSYEYKVSAKGYRPQTGTATVAGSAVTISTITLVAK